MKTGDFIYISQGEYSDYRVHGVFVVIEPFDVKQEVGKWRDAESTLSFPNWLREKKIVADVDADEVWVDEDWI